MDQHTLPIVYIVFRSGYRPLKLPLSCEVVQKVGFGPPICRERGYPRFWTYVFKSQLLQSMWPILVEFRSASSEIRRRKKERRKKEERIRGKAKLRRHTMSGSLINGCWRRVVLKHNFPAIRRRKLVWDSSRPKGDALETAMRTRSVRYKEKRETKKKWIYYKKWTKLQINSNTAQRKSKRQTVEIG